MQMAYDGWWGCEDVGLRLHNVDCWVSIPMQVLLFVMLSLACFTVQYLFNGSLHDLTMFILPFWVRLVEWLMSVF